ncbi:MAG TPA: hypothetical protein VHC86_08125 [Opitutaceae bacterium]|nr:hypothetical protein [Opitutaceae bacterium]
MKDSEFIGLLNLYLDHEITAEDSARLEAEVLRDPERRRLYRQYCQMQKACVVLADQSRESAPAEEILAATFAPRPVWGGGLWAAGVLAAAACAGFALLGHWRASPEAPPLAAAPAAAAVALSAPAPGPSAALPPLQKLQPVFDARSLTASGASQPALFAPASGDPQFAWMSRIQMTPIQSVSVDKLLAEPKPALQLDSRPDASANGAVETAAFQFQR